MGRKKTHGNLPSFKELIIPTINALIELGGSGTVEEINTKVYEIAKLKEETLQIPHGEDGSLTEIDYRLSWSRTYLKKYGLLENSSRGVWALSKSDIDIKKLDYEGIVKSVREGN
ncbi:MAG: winged helix-turn-helix domain-containing protein, partial [Candidatus Kapaibacterium sp.]